MHEWVVICAQFFINFIDFNSLSSKSPNVFVWSFRSFVSKSAAMLSKIATNCQNTLHRFRRDQSSGTLTGDCSPLMAFVLCVAISRRQGRIVCRK